jgi:hypothetical protein
MKAMSKFILPDAIPDQTHLMTLLRLAEAGYWDAFDDYLSREGLIAPETLSPEEVRAMLRRCVGADRTFTCCLCSEQKTGWGNNPSPLNDEDDARCCDSCNNDKVIPQRIRDATNAYAVITKKEA